METRFCVSRIKSIKRTVAFCQKVSKPHPILAHLKSFFLKGAAVFSHVRFLEIFKISRHRPRWKCENLSWGMVMRGRLETG